MSIPKEKATTSSNNSMPNTEMVEKHETIIAQQLKMQFHGTRKEDLETIESYLKKLKSIADSLTAIGYPVSDPDLVLQLLAGLPPQYLLLKNTISSRFPLPDFPEASSMLYEYDKSLLEQQKTSNPPNQSANLVGAPENSYSSKSTVEIIHEFTSIVKALTPIARDLLKAVGSWSGGNSSRTAATKTAPAGANRGSKKNTKGRGGKGNNKRGGGGGPSTNNNSGRK